MIANTIPIAVMLPAAGPIVSKIILEIFSMVLVSQGFLRTPTVGRYERINVVCIVREAV
jgi:hypothetical protein